VGADESKDTDPPRDEKAEKPDQKPKDQQPEKPKSKLPLIIGGIVLLAAILAGGWYWWSTRDLESTDDAYTEGRAISLAPKVGGYVTELLVGDNQLVHAGDLILRIDPRDYEAQKRQAAAALLLAQTQLKAAEIDLDVARVRIPAQQAQAEAQLAAAQAAQAQAEADYARQRRVDPRATTQTSIDTANAAVQTRRAETRQAQAQLDVAKLTQQNLALSAATVDQRRAQVTQAEAQLNTAELNLSYTELRAPQDGRVTKRNVEKGSLLQAGATIMSLVTPEVWVAANFKETQLDRMRPGQPVEIEVDAFPALSLHGHVDSIQQGSGSRFSTFPAENATGNFVKIVRRVPVKIVIDRGLDPNQPLPLGLSVSPTVTVR